MSGGTINTGNMPRLLQGGKKKKSTKSINLGTPEQRPGIRSYPKPDNTPKATTKPKSK